MAIALGAAGLAYGAYKAHGLLKNSEAGLDQAAANLDKASAKASRASKVYKAANSAITGTKAGNTEVGKWGLEKLKNRADSAIAADNEAINNFNKARRYHKAAKIAGGITLAGTTALGAGVGALGGRVLADHESEKEEDLREKAAEARRQSMLSQARKNKL